MKIEKLFKKISGKTVDQIIDKAYRIVDSLCRAQCQPGRESGYPFAG